MTLDEYRLVIFRKVTSCSGELAGQWIIDEAAGELETGNISAVDRTSFWRQLNADLSAESRKRHLIIEKQGAASLSQIIAAAQAVIAQHQAQATARK